MIQSDPEVSDMTRVKKKILPYIMVVFSCCCFSACSVGLIINCAGLFYEPIATEFGVGIGSVSLVTTVIATISGLASPLVMKFYQKFPLRRILVIAAAVSWLGLIGISKANCTTDLYFCAALLGISSPFFSMVPLVYFISNWFHRSYGLAVGLAQSFSGIGGALFSQILGALLPLWGWRSCYIAMSFLLVILLLPAFFFLRREPKELGLVPFGNGTVSQTQKTTSESKEVFSINALILCCAISGLSCFVTGMPSHFSNYAASRALPTQIGVSMVTAAMVSNSLFKTLAGILGDRIGPRRACNLMLILSSFGFLLLRLFRSGNAASYYLASMLLACSYAVYSVGLSAVMRERYRSEDFSRMYAYVQTSASLGSGVAFSVIGFSFDFFGSYNIALSFCFILLIMCLFFIGKLYRKM